MTTLEHYRKNIQLAWPVMLGQLGHVLVGLADSIMVGQLGTIPLAAGAFANAIFNMLMVFGIGMAIGLTTPIANADGENKPEKAANYLKHGLVTNMLTALILFLVIATVSFFTDRMGQEPQVVEQSSSYLLIITSSIFPLMLFLTFKQFAEGLSDTRFAMVASLGANLLNIFLNYLLIFGHWGFPFLGLDGAGYATLIARVIMALAMFLYVFRSKKFRTHLANWMELQWKRSYFKKLLSLGIPSGLQYIFEVSSFAVAAIIVGQINAEALAAHQIAISLASLSYMAASGLGSAATVRVGNQLGRRDIYSMLKAGHTNFILALGFMLFCGLLFYLGRSWFPTLYTDDLRVQYLASQLLIVAVIFQLSDGLQVTALGALRGMSEVKVPVLITFIAYWLVGVGAAYSLGIIFEFGPLGVWYGLALGLTVAAVLLFLRFEWKSKKLLHEFTAD
ncbi:MAG TPA: MATE family efflux transporter [Cryomorphaceae bacterium]|nr:MATE family efflux transporter [Cryomorphaceae bacterium]